MRTFYKKNLVVLLLSVMIMGTAYGQKTKIKTITIVNGDTTVNKEIYTDKDFAWGEKNGKKDKKVKVMKIITSGEDSTNEDNKIKMLMDDEEEVNDKKSFTKKIIIMNDGGKIQTVESENNYSYEVEIEDHEKKERRIRTEDDTKTGKGKHKIVQTQEPNTDNALLLKNIYIDVDTKVQTLKLDATSESKEAINVVVMDETGKQVFYDVQQQGNNYKNEIKLDKKGIYFLSIIQNKKILNERIVME